MSSGGKKIAMNALAEVQVVYQVYQKKINERVEKSFQFSDKVVIKKGFCEYDLQVNLFQKH